MLNMSSLLRQIYIRHTVRLVNIIYRAKWTLCTCDIWNSQDFRQSTLFRRHTGLFQQSLNVSSRHKSKKTLKESNDDRDSDNEEVEDVDDEDDFEDVPGVDGYKHKKVHSLRSDHVIAHSLGYSSSETQKLFYSSKLLTDGKVLLKKSKKVKEGDTLEVVVKDSESVRTVRRIEIVKVSDKLTKKGSPIVYVRVWRTQFEVDVS